jgi:hypothetical protein
VRGTGMLMVLVTGPDADPDAERDGAHRGQVLGYDPEPARKDSAADTIVSFGIHLFVVAAGAVPRPAMPVLPLGPLAAVPVTAVVPGAVAAIAT